MHLNDHTLQPFDTLHAVFSESSLGFWYYHLCVLETKPVLLFIMLQNAPDFGTYCIIEQ